MIPVNKHATGTENTGILRISVGICNLGGSGDRGKHRQQSVTTTVAATTTATETAAVMGMTKTAAAAMAMSAAMATAMAIAKTAMATGTAQWRSISSEGHWRDVGLWGGVMILAPSFGFCALHTVHYAHPW